MSTKNVSVLFIKEDNSEFHVDPLSFEHCFNHTDIANNTSEALKFSDANHYDLIINDVSIALDEGTKLLRHMKQMMPKAALFAFVAPQDEENMGELLDMGVNAFVLTPEQFEQAIHAIADMQA